MTRCAAVTAGVIRLLLRRLGVGRDAGRRASEDGELQPLTMEQGTAELLGRKRESKLPSEGSAEGSA